MFLLQTGKIMSAKYSSIVMGLVLLTVAMSCSSIAESENVNADYSQCRDVIVDNQAFCSVSVIEVIGNAPAISGANVVIRGYVVLDEGENYLVRTKEDVSRTSSTEMIFLDIAGSAMPGYHEVYGRLVWDPSLPNPFRRTVTDVVLVD